MAVTESGILDVQPNKAATSPITVVKMPIASIDTAKQSHPWRNSVQIGIG